MQKMGIRRRTKNIESIITSNRIVILNWLGKGCPPCKDQQGTLDDIKKETGSPQISIFNLDHSDYKKKFKKLGNVVLPSLNLFVDTKPITFIDTKLAPVKRMFTGFRKEKLVEKRVKALAGGRSEEDLIKVFNGALGMLAGNG